jgi:ABC-2 type transport system ATP-binding protein
MASELKRQVGADRLALSFPTDNALDAALSTIGMDGFQVDRDRRTLAVSTTDGASELYELLGKLDSAGVEVETASLGRPTLDDVFLALTGHAATTNGAGDAADQSGATG